MQEFTLEETIDDKTGRLYFRQYLEKCSNSEPLLFIELVEEYKKLKNRQNRQKKAEEIIKKFIMEGSWSEINISQTTRANAMKNFEIECQKECDIHLFDESVIQVLIMLKDDVWPRFLKSDEFQHMVSEMLGDEGKGDEVNPSLTDSVPDEELKKNIGFNTSSIYISDDEFELVKRWSFSEKEVADTEWKQLAKKEFASAYITKKSIKAYGSHRSIKMWKLCGYISEPVELVLSAAYDAPLRFQNDGNLSETKHLTYIKNSNVSKYALSIVAERYRFPLMSDRVIVLSGSIKLETYGPNKLKRYIVTRKTANGLTMNGVRFDSKKKKRNDHFVLADFVGGTIFEQVNENNTITRVYEMGWLDLKGTLPLWLWNKLVSTRGTVYHQGLIKSTKVLKTRTTDTSKILKVQDDHMLQTDRKSVV